MNRRQPNKVDTDKMGDLLQHSSRKEARAESTGLSAGKEARAGLPVLLEGVADPALEPPCTAPKVYCQPLEPYHVEN
jgi:hypothetical protein